MYLLYNLSWSLSWTSPWWFCPCPSRRDLRSHRPHSMCRYRQCSLSRISLAECSMKLNRSISRYYLTLIFLPWLTFSNSGTRNPYIGYSAAHRITGDPRRRTEECEGWSLVSTEARWHMCRAAGTTVPGSGGCTGGPAGPLVHTPIVKKKAISYVWWTALIGWFSSTHTLQMQIHSRNLGWLIIAMAID